MPINQHPARHRPTHLRVISGGRRQPQTFTFPCPKCGVEVDKRNLGKVLAHEAPHTRPEEVEGAALLGPKPYESD